MSSKKIVFLGSKSAGLDILKRIVARLPRSSVVAVICPDDSADKRSRQDDFRQFAVDKDLPFHLVETKRDLVQVLQAYAPDAAIVHGWYRLIPVSEVSKTKFFGFHYSQLPRYRGNAPLVWQIINGEQRLGVSFFELGDGLDDGLLVAQETFDFHVNESIADALDKASAIAEQMVDDFSVAWLGDGLILKEQPDLVPSYCGLRRPEDGKIDWNLPAGNVHDFVRAQTHPYPGAFATLPDGTKVYIWKSAVEPRTFYGTPGAVVEVSKGKVVVACGSGALVVLKVQVEMKEPEPVEAVIGSLQMRLG